MSTVTRDGLTFRTVQLVPTCWFAEKRNRYHPILTDKYWTHDAEKATYCSMHTPPSVAWPSDGNVSELEPFVSKFTLSENLDTFIQEVNNTKAILNPSSTVIQQLVEAARQVDARIVAHLSYTIVDHADLTEEEKEAAMSAVFQWADSRARREIDGRSYGPPRAPEPRQLSQGWHLKPNELRDVYWKGECEAYSCGWPSRSFSETKATQVGVNPQDKYFHIHCGIDTDVWDEEGNADSEKPGL